MINDGRRAEIDRERLKGELREQGISQASLAKLVGASPAAIQQILNGKTQTTKLDYRIADALGVSLNWLCGQDVDKHTKFIVETNDDDLRPIVLLYFTDSADMQSDMGISPNLVAISGRWAKNIFQVEEGVEKTIIIRTKSPEMAPLILPGDDLGVRWEREFDGNPDSVWLFTYSGRIFTRRIRRDSDGMLICVADNPLYSPFIVAESELEIRGRVVWQGRSLPA